jgi:PKD-like domain
MKKLTVLLIAVLAATDLLAQNLVNNGDFSVKAAGTGCPSYTGFTSGRPDGWWDKATKPQGFLPYAETPDYYHPCAPTGTYNPGSNRIGCADPKSGTAYTGLLAWELNNPNRSSEYIYQELPYELIKNQDYYIEFWVSLADDDEVNYSVASLGMYLTKYPSDFAGAQNRGYHILASSVQIPETFPANNYYTTTNGWQRISGTYTPTVDGVKHILIGNFDPGIEAYDPVTNPNSPNIQYRSTPYNGAGQTSYYFIDAVYIAPANQGVPNLDPVISGPDAICSSGTPPITVSNFPVAASVTWTTSPTNLVTPNSGSGPSADVSAISQSTQGEVTITFQINGVCDQQSVSENFTVGRPSGIVGTMTGPSSVTISQVAWYRVPDESQADGTFYWTLPSGFSITSQGNGYHQVQVWIQNGASSGYVQVWKTNNCGISGTTRYIYVNVDSGGGGSCPKCIIQSIVTPNPAVNDLSIQYADKKTNITVAYDEFARGVKYVITDSYGNVVFTKSSKKTRDKLNLSSIRKNGTYILSIYYGDGSGVEQVRFVIER